MTDDQRATLTELLEDELQRKKIKKKFRARTGIPWPQENAFDTISGDIKKPLREIENIILQLSDEKTRYATTNRNINMWFFKELGVESRCFDATY